MASRFIFKGYDPDIFISNISNNQRREDLISVMMDGDKPPVDKNFFHLNTGDTVLVSSKRGLQFTGKIIKSECGCAYIIETESDGLVTHRLLHPNAKISSDRPTVFTPDKPNHHTVFINEKDMDLSRIDFILEYSKSYGISVFEIIKNLENTIEKYPEEFV